MLTDDDLTRRLGAAFRSAAGGLEYTGRVPAPRSPIVTVGVPLATSAAVAATLAVVWASSPGTDGETPPSAGGPTATLTPSTPKVSTEKVTVAGFTFSYRRAAGDTRADDLYAKGHVTVPDDASPIDAPEGVQAWVGRDPESGDNAVYVKAPTRNAGAVFAILSPTWTTGQLTDLFRHGDRDARPIPSVG